MVNRQRRILITGGSGFIGTNAVEYFSNAGHYVLNIDINSPRNPLHKKFWKNCDILDYSNYSRLVLKFNPEYFLHLAARTDLNETKSIQGYASNIEGVTNTIKILNNLKDIIRIIFASSRMVCKIGYLPKNENDFCPPNLYGKSKQIGEQIVRSSGLNKEWVIVRPTSIWGEWFDVPYKNFFDTIYYGTYYNPGNVNPAKSFGYVGNSIYQLDKLLSCNSALINKKTLYLCDYPPLKVLDWARLINTEFQRTKDVKIIPYKILKIIALVGDILYKIGWHNIPLQSFRFSNLITEMVYPTAELYQIVGNLPYTLNEGVKRTVYWYLKHLKS